MLYCAAGTYVPDFTAVPLSETVRVLCMSIHSPEADQVRERDRMEDRGEERKEGWMDGWMDDRNFLSLFYSQHHHELDFDFHFHFSYDNSDSRTGEDEE